MCNKLFKNLKFVGLMGTALGTLSFSGHTTAQANDLRPALVPQESSFLIQVSETDGVTAQKFIDDMGQQAIGFLSNDKLSISQKEAEFRKLLKRNFDMETIARFASGKNWKTATSEQQKEYLKLFENMIVEVYSARFNDYKGEEFDVASFRDNGKKDILVTSYIVPDNGSKVQVDWRVRNRDGQYKIIDVIIEGVSMSLTQRSDFSSVIQRGGGEFEILLSHLRK